MKMNMTQLVKSVAVAALFTATSLGTAHAETIKSACGAWLALVDTASSKIAADPNKFRDLVKTSTRQGVAPTDEQAEASCMTAINTDARIRSIDQNPFGIPIKSPHYKFEHAPNKQTKYQFGF